MAKKQKSKATRSSKRVCKHTFWAFCDDGHGEYRKCPSCGSMFALGPSNDATPEVQIEMRAAELEETEFWKPLRYITKEMYGHADHDLKEPDLAVERQTNSAWLAGYLARELETHSNHSTRDAAAWSWAIDRSLAEQLAETEQADTATKRLDLDLDELAETEQVDTAPNRLDLGLDELAETEQVDTAPNQLKLDPEKPPTRHQTLRDCEKALETQRPNHQQAQDGEIWICPCDKRFEHVCDEAEGCSWAEVS